MEYQDFDWNDILNKRLKARRQILFSKEDCPIFTLMMDLESLPRKVTTLWALEMAALSAEVLEKRYVSDPRPGIAVEQSRLWAQGNVKMVQAKCAILDCHAMANELSDLSDIALCHAVGQACSTVHTVRHAIGYPIYHLTAIVRENGVSGCNDLISQAFDLYYGRLGFWSHHYLDDPALKWASFIEKGEH